MRSSCNTYAGLSPMVATEAPRLVTEVRQTTNEFAAPVSAHLPALDGLRGIAIALVLITHCEKALAWNPQSDWLVKALNKIVCFSTCGVDLFFVLSGFLITGILLRSRESAKYFQSFYMRRALRIFPLYYGVLLIILCATSLFGEPPDGMMGTAANRTWLWFYGTNILISINQCWNSSGSLNHLWSLAVEEHFYLVWPFLVIALRPKPLVWLCLASIPASVLIRSTFVGPLHNELAAYVLTICRVDSLLVGCFIALVAHFGHLNRLKKPSKTIVVAMAVIVPAFIFFVPHFSTVDRIVGPTIFALLFGAVLVLTLVSSSLTRTFENPMLCTLGKYSYGLYMYHAIVIAGLERVWNWTALPQILNYVVFLSVASTLSIVMAAISYHCYEVHFLKLKRYFQT